MNIEKILLVAQTKLRSECNFVITHDLECIITKTDIMQCTFRYSEYGNEIKTWTKSILTAINELI